MSQVDSSITNFSFNCLEHTNDQLGIEHAHDVFQPDVLPGEANVLEFWESQKGSLLYDVAIAAFIIPPTQVQVKRDFSSLGHIFTERRYRLSEDLLEAIMLINLNKELFYLVKQEQLNSIIF